MLWTELFSQTQINILKRVQAGQIVSYPEYGKPTLMILEDYGLIKDIGNWTYVKADGVDIDFTKQPGEGTNKKEEASEN